jgi:hypothetical protein
MTHAAEALFSKRARPCNGHGWVLCVVIAVAASTAVSSHASAQQAEESPDVTRLDVERLPPEALAVTRDMYNRGLFVAAQLGARGFVGGIGDVSKPGLYAELNVGYELWSWLAVYGGLALSLHNTDGQAPPSPTTLEIPGALIGLRAQLDFSARSAMWLAADVGALWVPGNYPSTYGIRDSESVGVMFGGALGFDWHLLTHHHSLGISVGVRRYPSLDAATGLTAIGIHGGPYLRYVF